MTANASDNVGVAGVQFRLDGAILGVEDTAPPYSVAWDTTTATNGSHSLTAVARDAAGNTTTSAAIAVTLTNVSTGLVAAYGFNESSGTTVGDASGKGNAGTTANTTWVANGKYGGALSFNGTNAWVTVPDSASLDLTTGMTLEAWLDPATLSSWRSAIMKETPNNLAWAIYANTSGNRYAGYAGSVVELDGRTQLPVSAWSFLTVTYDGATVKVYLNGALISSRASAITMPVTTQPLRIGGNAIWGEWFNGLIDEIRIYNRALTAAEISTDMAKPVG
jgi:hypothetical protein